ncbi:MAG: ribulokinase, partial [Defluviitaleaceae bacterium]|nr:ribulokinase [Defluviitaleaceae bacterium]
EIYVYEHAVITGSLPESGVALDGPDWALQDPDDYLRALTTCIPSVIGKSGVAPEQIVGIGVDFTLCTVVPTDENLAALCTHPQWRNRPHAWVKLWKNHTAWQEADDITRYVQHNGLDTLDSYGGSSFSEFFFPKVWEVFRKDPEVYNAAHTFMEGGDFVVSRLCGKLARSGVLAGAKGYYNNETGAYPSRQFFRGLDPGLENIVRDKHLHSVVPVGSVAGNLTPEMARELGLPAGIIVCAAHGDAAVTLPGCGIAKPNIMSFIMGTSTCHVMMAREKVNIPGMSAVYYEGVLPGYYCYEAGQSAVGDIFGWFCDNYTPAAYAQEAASRGISALEIMGEKAAHLNIGQGGLVALDWMNGNRCVLSDTSLSGMILGLTLATKPEEIYRALLEATAFGTKIIVDRFGEYGVAVNEVYACGGLAHKSPLLMQMYADVLGRTIHVSGNKQTAALASALFAAVAAEVHGSYEAAVASMIPAPSRTYHPDADSTQQYAKLFGTYKQLHDYFGLGEGAALMKGLRT